ncbi:hypothetical protein [Senegalia massiliensis]|uniref:hypothetical protein n=1 Tax=Senegalia massiliensis TaxID=1720316 RepID=UPI0010303901|nr:hypothetical protein [Senegalia massiliensis]
MKKILVLLMVLLMAFSLIACGDSSNEEDTSDDAKTKESSAEDVDDSKDDSEGKTEESEIGKRTTIKSKKDLNIVKETGPFTMIVTDVQISTLEPSEDYKDMFDGKDKITFVTIATEVENKSEDTNSFYPDQGTITTDTKEQVDADLMLSDEVGGDFIGEVAKKGNVIFFLDSPAEEINNIKYVIEGPHNENIDRLGEGITYEISFE